MVRSKTPLCVVRARVRRSVRASQYIICAHTRKLIRYTDTHRHTDTQQIPNKDGTRAGAHELNDNQISAQTQRIAQRPRAWRSRLQHIIGTYAHLHTHKPISNHLHLIKLSVLRRLR